MYDFSTEQYSTVLSCYQCIDAQLVDLNPHVAFIHNPSKWFLNRTSPRYAKHVFRFLLFCSNGYYDPPPSVTCRVVRKVMENLSFFSDERRTFNTKLCSVNHMLPVF
jgi:hypothetical protein